METKAWDRVVWLFHSDMSLYTVIILKRRVFISQSAPSFTKLNVLWHFDGLYKMSSALTSE